MSSQELHVRLERALHLVNQIRFAENVLDELFFSRHTISIAPPPIDFFSSYTDTIFKSVAEAKAQYENQQSFAESGTTESNETSTSSFHSYPEDFGKIIGQRIKEKRCALGLTQSDLAAATQIRRPNIARLEKGQSLPNLATLIKISESLQIPLELFLKLQD